MSEQIRIRDDEGSPIPLSRAVGQAVLRMVQESSDESSVGLTSQVIESHWKLLSDALDDVERYITAEIGWAQRGKSDEKLSLELRNIRKVRQEIAARRVGGALGQR